MEGSAYTVMVNGQLLPGTDLEQAKARLAAIFKLEPTQAERLLSGKPRAIKRGVSAEAARKLEKALRRAGVASRVVEATAGVTGSSAPAQEEQGRSLEVTASELNPYQTPHAPLEDARGVAPANAAAIRQELLGHEAGLRAAGLLYYLGTLGSLIAGSMMLTLSSAASGTVPIGPALGAFFLALGALQGWVGYGLRHLRPSARIPAGILSGIGLLGFPMGTIINGYVLYLLFSQKGNRIFADDYLDIVAATPDMKYRTHPVVWAILVLILLAIAAAIAVPMLTSTPS